MIHQILQSDIDLARRLAKAGHTDEHIVEVLCLRGIPRVRAAQLTDDIRQGREVKPDFDYLPEMEIAPEYEEQKERPEPRARTREPRQSRRPHRRRSPFFWGGILLLSLLIALALVFILNKHRPVPAGPEPAPSGGEPGGPTNPVPRPQAGKAAPLRVAEAPVLHSAIRLHVTNDGVRLGSGLLNRSNILAELSQLLGAPTHTNSPADASVLTYGFDADGLLLNAAPTPSLIIDFDGLGTAEGCRLGFAGELHIGSTAIRPTTPAEAIAALNPAGTYLVGLNGGTLTCQIGGADLSFVYLTNCSHLNLVEIKLGM